MNKKMMKKEIKNMFEGVPEAQIEAGKYLDKVGHKYVHMLNTWDGTRIELWPIEVFYKKYIEKGYVSQYEEDAIKVK